jgi:hypothetical protein
LLLCIKPAIVNRRLSRMEQSLRGDFNILCFLCHFNKCVTVWYFLVLLQ